MSRILDWIFLRLVRIRCWYGHRMMLAWRQYRAEGGELRLRADVVARSVACKAEGEGVPWDR